MYDNPHLPEGHLLRGKRVAIVGGGLAGLTLARLLQLRDVFVNVYERDAGPNARAQGGSLDLHKESGQLAINRCGLDYQFHAVSRPEGQASLVYDKHGILRASSNASQESQSSPEIDRGQLRDLLRGSLADGTEIWDRQLVELAWEDGVHKLIFTNAAPAWADLVIGCDGAWSKVRRFLSPLTPYYTGVSFIETCLSDADRRHPKIAAIVGRGSAMSLGDHKGLLAQRNGDGSIRVYVARRISESWITEKRELDARTPAAMRAEMLAWFADWAPSLTDMLSRSDDEFILWPLYAMPMQPAWPTGDGVTVIGDAAHVMPPFLGAGANMAMLDAVELADHLCSDRFSDIKKAIASFEHGMRERMAPMIEQSVATQDVLFADDAPDGLASLIASQASEDR
jgi:2-polyprenyl-6-methoxyphenol hydroxylase-like FAD-dependent oxidoreductase